MQAHPIRLVTIIRFFFFAGFSNTAGSGNVFLGNEAGYKETGSNKLYIDNSDTSTPLIYGQFDLTS